MLMISRSRGFSIPSCQHSRGRRGLPLNAEVRTLRKRCMAGIRGPPDCQPWADGFLLFYCPSTDLVWLALAYPILHCYDYIGPPLLLQLIHQFSPIQNMRCSVWKAHHVLLPTPSPPTPTLVKSKLPSSLSSSCHIWEALCDPQVYVRLLYLMLSY